MFAWLATRKRCLTLCLILAPSLVTNHKAVGGHDEGECHLHQPADREHTGTFRDGGSQRKWKIDERH
jgi:hypothetical protein